MGLPDVPPGIEAKCNAAIDVLMPQIEEAQAVFSASHNGRYWQGIISAPLQQDGADAATDRSRHPHDQVQSWEDMSIDFPSHCPIAAQVDVWDGPLGCGYRCSFWLELAGEKWTSGPEKAWVKQPDWVL